MPVSVTSLTRAGQAAFDAQPGIKVMMSGMDEVILMRGFGGFCVPSVFVDGFRSNTEQLMDLRPGDLAGLEVYRTPTTAPIEYQVFSARAECGSIVAWTKSGARWN